jgi:hypothetical protein
MSRLTACLLMARAGGNGGVAARLDDDFHAIPTASCVSLTYSDHGVSCDQAVDMCAYRATEGGVVRG